MRHEYKYSLNRHTWYWTFVHVSVFAVILASLPYLFDGGYMVAWAVSVLTASVLMMVLSIPRKIVVSKERVEIVGISDYTPLPYSGIARVRRVAAKETRFFLPLFASAGFFGFYGWFVNLQRMEAVKVYASSWRNFVEITRKDGRKYYVSCGAAAEFVDRANRNMEEGATAEDNG